MKKLLILSIAIFINSPVSNAQYSLFSLKNNKKLKTKKEVVKPDPIKDKTKGCEVFDGLFKIYQNKKNGKSFIEIDTSHLDKEFIYFSYIENGVTDAGAVKGSYRGSKIIKISKFYNKIDFTINNTRYFFDEESQLSKASNTNINTPLIISEEIIVKSDDKTRFLINADNIFLNESLQQVKYSYPGGYKGFRLGNLSKSKTRYNKIRNYPENTDVVVNYYYESKYPSRRGGEAITDSRNVSVLVQHSLVRMPDDNYIPRTDDTRVGFFTTQSNHMTTLDQVNYRDFINRWRLEKKDTTKEFSEPVKPIVYWIENTTPLEFRDIIKEGVERWNIAFKEAGFINAIQVKIQPDTAEWDAGDIRYNVLRWTSSPNPPWGGYGPSFVNPRTGEILGADIMLEWSYVTNRIVADNLYNDNSLEDKNCCTAAHFQQVENSLGINYIKNMNLGEEMEEELVKQSLYRLVLHEVGHTIGLNHNFKASALLTTDELNNKEIVDEKGVTSSVMDYPAININKNPENQALFFDVKPGFYDIWAIQFGYTQFSENEEGGLDKILSRSTEKELAFANDALDMRSPGKGSDPNAMIYDLSSNQLDHSVDKINMVVDILKNLKSKYTSDNDTYEELYRSYINLVYSYYQALNIVNKILLQEDLFPYLMKQRRGFNVSTDPTIHQRILRYQNYLLNHLLNSRVLLRISNSSLYGNEYKLPYYMIDLRNSIFASDIDKNVSTIRQNIQVSYVNRLLSIVNPKSSYDNLAKTSAYYNLNWLKDNLDSKVGNLQTRQHKDYILYLIDSLESNK